MQHECIYAVKCYRLVTSLIVLFDMYFFFVKYKHSITAMCYDNNIMITEYI